MPLEIRKWIEFSEKILCPTIGCGRRTIIAAVVRNPYSAMDTEDLDKIIEPSLELGEVFARELLSKLNGAAALAYGKGALVGMSGEFEHGKGFLTNRFVDPIRKALGDLKSWVPSTCKKGKEGAVLDLPLGNVNDLWSEERTQTISLGFPDCPRADEVVVLFAVSY